MYISSLEGKGRVVGGWEGGGGGEVSSTRQYFWAGDEGWGGGLVKARIQWNVSDVRVLPPSLIRCLAVTLFG